MFAAMAIAATWVISTARSPTAWQPKILNVSRSAMSLQKPFLRPSIIVRVVVSKGRTAVRTSCVSRAFASVRPTWAYSGSVKLPIGLTASPIAVVGPSTALVAATKPVLYRLRHQHHATGNVPSSEDMGYRRS